MSLSRALPSSTTSTLVAPLRDLRRGDTSWVGVKAANLGELLAAGFPVPDGFVITVAAFQAHLEALPVQIDPDTCRSAPLPAAVREAILSQLQTLGDVPLAVRSSSVAEDLEGASFAGQYDSFLDVRGPEAVLEAVRRCWASAFGARVAAYRRDREEGSMAVLVQRLVPADAAGVCFTANPLTGDRQELVVSAVRGLGERLVSGEARADEWVIREGRARRRASPESAVLETVIFEIAALARRVEAHFGAPQDIEWAWAQGRVQLVQARPITALPEVVRWEAPLPGTWLRNVRFGELLPEPITPLFASWGIDRIMEGYCRATEEDSGIPMPPRPWHVVVNGWYFYSPVGPRAAVPGLLSLVLTWLRRRPRLCFAFMIAANGRPEAFDPIASSLYTRWQLEQQPRYRARVEAGEARVPTASAAELIALVDEIALLAGACFWTSGIVGGWGWKAEAVLARFYARHLLKHVGGTHQTLLCGLGAPQDALAHVVQSLDWFRPTRGELAMAPEPPGAAEARLARLRETRLELEASCREALSRSPRKLARFKRLLTFTQRYSLIHEELLAHFTIGWPLMRRALLRLGELLQDRGILEHREDVFWLTRSELEGSISRVEAVSKRRADWERHRKLTPPLFVGRWNPIFAPYKGKGGADPRSPPGAIEGMPASPGRASGVVRKVMCAEDFGRLEAGDVLIAQVTTPAYTPLFARAAAVVTDGGSLTAHASLVAREYGIPAVVATGDATRRLEEGQRVTVDGTRGWVEVEAPAGRISSAR